MISRLMLNLRDPKILKSSTNRTTMTTTEYVSGKAYPVMSTFIDPSPSMISNIEEQAIYMQGDIYTHCKEARPIGELNNQSR